MANDPFFWIVALAALAVLAILMFGIGTFAKGGEFNRKYANRIMRWPLFPNVALLFIGRNQEGPAR